MPRYEIKNPTILANPSYIAAKAALEIAEDVKDKYEEMIVSRAYEKYALNGGCPKCRGRGWVVVWDTMDSMTGCYAEYGTCDHEGCTPESRAKSGLLPCNNKYDNFNTGSTWTMYTEMTDIEASWHSTQIVAPYARAKDAFNKLVRELVEAAEPKKGMRVRVNPVSGRPVGNHDRNSKAGEGRVAVGTEGIITWARVDANTSSSTWGTKHYGTFSGKACIALTDAKFANGKFRDIAWIDVKHLEIIS